MILLHKGIKTIVVKISSHICFFQPSTTACQSCIPPFLTNRPTSTSRAAQFLLRCSLNKQGQIIGRFNSTFPSVVQKILHLLVCERLHANQPIRHRDATSTPPSHLHHYLCSLENCRVCALDAEQPWIEAIADLKKKKKRVEQIRILRLLLLQTATFSPKSKIFFFFAFSCFSSLFLPLIGCQGVVFLSQYPQNEINTD